MTAAKRPVDVNAEHLAGGGIDAPAGRRADSDLEPDNSRPLSHQRSPCAAIRPACAVCQAANARQSSKCVASPSLETQTVKTHRDES